MSGPRYDILAFVENPNTDWIAQIEYHFNYAGEQSSTDTIVVNQQSRLALTKLGIEGARSHAVELVIDDVLWQKIDIKFPTRFFGRRKDGIWRSARLSTVQTS